MKFCQSCEVRLRKSDSGLRCPKCGMIEGEDVVKKPVMEDSTDSEFNVLDETEAKEELPTIKIDCGKCGHNKAVWWMLQTRSADEATTQFYRCIKCGHTWRNYD